MNKKIEIDKRTRTIDQLTMIDSLRLASSSKTEKGFIKFSKIMNKKYDSLLPEENRQKTKTIFQLAKERKVKK